MPLSKPSDKRMLKSGNVETEFTSLITFVEEYIFEQDRNMFLEQADMLLLIFNHRNKKLLKSLI
jgi:hypothetical protein